MPSGWTRTDEPSQTPDSSTPAGSPIAHANPAVAPPPNAITILEGSPHGHLGPPGASGLQALIAWSGSHWPLVVVVIVTVGITAIAVAAGHETKNVNRNILGG